MPGGSAAFAPFSVADVMVDCAEFLDAYSDYRDGLLTADRQERFEAHVRICGSCARYDRVVGGGVQVFRSLPQLRPSPDFQLRLLSRLHTLEGPGGPHASGTSVAVTIMICLTLGVGAWLPTLRPRAEAPVMLPPIVAHAPYHDLTPVLMRGMQPLRSATFHPQPAFYGPGLFLENSLPLTTLAYRPASLYYPPR